MKHLTVEQPRIAKPEQGFTMIELLVTMLLLAVVLLGLAALQVSTIRQVTSSKRANEATRLAQLIIERYKTMDYSLISDTGGNWATEINQLNLPMQGVGPDGVARGPFTAVTLIEGSLGGWLLTVQVRWLSQARSLEANQQLQYRMKMVTLSTQRFPQ